MEIKYLRVVSSYTDDAVGYVGRFERNDTVKFIAHTFVILILKWLNNDRHKYMQIKDKEKNNFCSTICFISGKDKGHRPWCLIPYS